MTGVLGQDYVTDVLCLPCGLVMTYLIYDSTAEQEREFTLECIKQSAEMIQLKAYFIV